MGEYAPNSTGLLAPLSRWLNDPLVSEILLNKPQEIYVEKKGVLERYVVSELTEHFLTMLFRLIANENHQELSEQKPLLSASLLDGSRIQIVLPPTAKNHTLAIRRRVIKNFTLHDYKRINFYSQARGFDLRDGGVALFDGDKKLVEFYDKKDWHQFILLAIKLKKNIVISGGTSSGKTTFLNACLSYLSLQERIIILEDTREIIIPHPNKVQLLVSKGQQGVAKLNLQDLLQCCLRLRPDRIICGEIRGKEVLDFLSACSTGHEGGFTTIHAGNPRIAFMRMMQMYKLNNVPFMSDKDIMRELHEVIDIVVQLSKINGKRLVHSIYYKNVEQSCLADII